jgi:hypothetical protein
MDNDETGISEAGGLQRETSAVSLDSTRPQLLTSVLMLFCFITMQT